MLYEVGKPYSETRRRWPPDTADYNWRSGEHELRLFYRRPTMQEVADIKSGELRLALLTKFDLIVFLWRFGRGEWSDKPYSYHLVPKKEQVLPDPGDEGGEKRRLLHVVLVDSDSGLVLALRAVSMSPEFTAALHDAIRAQAFQPWPGDDAYAVQIQQLYAEFPSSSAMVLDASARCVGGD